MDLRQLRALIAVAEHGTFSAAAKSLHTVQSNVSTHVARLERELDTTLIDRKTNELTAEGEAVATRSRRVLSEMDAISSDVAAFRDDIRGSVRLGMIGTTGRWLLPRLLDSMAETYPGIRLVIVDATTTSLTPQLVAGQLDAAVVQLPVNDPDLVTEPLFEEDRIVIAPSGHPWAKKTSVDISDLGAHPLLCTPPGTAFRDLVDAEVRQAGSAITPLAEIDGMRLLATMAFQGFGPALVPASAAPVWLTGDWSRVRVDGLSRREVGFARPSRTTPSAPTRAVHDVLTELTESEAAGQPGLYLPAT
ncbi:MAG: LysR family transcriptional regulator [Acidimicrobiales bacterium]|nr:LysR family transcriptional regulator [Acidimicrobiales bacterium]